MFCFVTRCEGGVSYLGAEGRRFESGRPDQRIPGLRLPEYRIEKLTRGKTRPLRRSLSNSPRWLNVVP